MHAWTHAYLSEPCPVPRKSEQQLAQWRMDVEEELPSQVVQRESPVVHLVKDNRVGLGDLVQPHRQGQSSHDNKRNGVGAGRELKRACGHLLRCVSTIIIV